MPAQGEQGRAVLCGIDVVGVTCVPGADNGFRTRIVVPDCVVPAQKSADTCKRCVNTEEITFHQIAFQEIVRIIRPAADIVQKPLVRVRAEQCLHFVVFSRYCVDVKNEIVHQICKCFYKFRLVARGLAPEMRCVCVQAFETFLERFQNVRLIGGNAHAVDLVGVDEIAFQRTDIVIHLTAALHVAVGAAFLIKIPDVHTIGVIPGGFSVVTDICVPDVGKSEDGNALIHTVLCTQVDVALHGSIIVDKCAVPPLCHTDDGIFVKIRVRGHLMAPLTVPRDL